jgi:uncharacterized protein (DUF952 family)
MPEPNPLPVYVYRLATEALPDPRPHDYKFPKSEHDERDGFIHLSEARQVGDALKLYIEDTRLTGYRIHQVAFTAEMFFGSVKKLWVIRLRTDKVVEDLKWEKGGDDWFPHLYRDFGNEDIDGADGVERGDETWTEVLRRSGLLK